MELVGGKHNPFAAVIDIRERQGAESFEATIVNDGVSPCL